MNTIPPRDYYDHDANFTPTRPKEFILLEETPKQSSPVASPSLDSINHEAQEGTSGYRASSAILAENDFSVDSIQQTPSSSMPPRSDVLEDSDKFSFPQKVLTVLMNNPGEWQSNIEIATKLKPDTMATNQPDTMATNQQVGRAICDLKRNPTRYSASIYKNVNIQSRLIRPEERVPHKHERQRQLHTYYPPHHHP